jgi:GMP synthase (glutamine-hydrolysing)
MGRHCLAIRHVQPEDLGSFEAPLREFGYTIEYIEAPLATPEDFERAIHCDLLVVLGGPIGVYDAAAYPFLLAEERVLQARLSAAAPILGLCLGAQLIAKALGSRVYPSGVSEIGWAPLRSAADLDPVSPAARLFEGESPIQMLHWHGDTYELPAGACRLASTDSVVEQGFSIGRHVLAFQCHPEFLPSSVESWLVLHAHELAAKGGDELITRIRCDTAAYGPTLVDRGRTMIRAWLAEL